MLLFIQLFKSYALFLCIFQCRQDPKPQQKLASWSGYQTGIQPKPRLMKFAVRSQNLGDISQHRYPGVYCSGTTSLWLASNRILMTINISYTRPAGTKIASFKDTKLPLCRFFNTSSVVCCCTEFSPKNNGQ